MHILRLTTKSPLRLWVFFRMSYHLATRALAAGAKFVGIYKGEKFPDHAPITMEYDFNI